MKILMIDTIHGGIWFSLTYLAAFIIAAAIMICQGFRKGYPSSSWLLIILSGVVFFIVGDKMFTYSPEQWTEVFTRFHFPEADKKTILGGIIGLFTGIFLATAWLRFNRPVLDHLAIALPVAMAVSRIGCLMAGCCFGTPTNLPWGIRYDATSWVYHVQQAQGLVHLHDQSSLAVHPSQLYQVIGCLFVAFIVWKSRRHWRSNGNLFLFSVLCYSILRFFVEFVRDPLSNGIAGQLIWGLKLVQWLILGAILLIPAIIFIRELKAKNYKTPSIQTYIPDLRQVLLMILLLIIIFAGRKWFDILELSTIILFLIPACINLVVKLNRRISVPGFRWVVPAILVCSFSFMAQMNIKDNDKIIFIETGISGMFGQYSEEIQKVDLICDGANYKDIATQSVPFYQAGVNFSYNTWQGRYNKNSFGTGLFYGQEYPDRTVTDAKNGMVFGISPYASISRKWFGFTGGISLGRMKIPIRKPVSALDEGEIISKNRSWFPIIPSFSIRVGPPDIFFAEGSYASGLFPYCSPFANFRTGVGTGFGKANGTVAFIGLCGSALYVKMVYPFQDKFVFEAFYAENFSTGDMASRVLSIGFSYRFITANQNQDLLKETSMQYDSWKTSPYIIKKLPDTMIDTDGNVYPVVSFEGQVWMAEDLKVMHFRNGSEITGISGQGNEKRYNWFAVIDSSDLCPAGWHVPSVDEWNSLINALGGLDLASERLKEYFSLPDNISRWWSSTGLDTLNASSIYLNTGTKVIIFPVTPKISSLSVRCIHD